MPQSHLMHRAAHLAAALLISSPHVLAAYNLVREYSGSGFFSGWDFYGNYDNLTNGESLLHILHQEVILKRLMGYVGDVNWVTQANATQSKLAYVDDSGHAIIKVDNTTFVPYNYKRDTVRAPPFVLFQIDALRHRGFGDQRQPAFGGNELTPLTLRRILPGQDQHHRLLLGGLGHRVRREPPAVWLFRT